MLSAAAAAREEPGGPAWRYLGVPYVSLPPIALVVLREDPDYGIAAIVLVMLMVWAADTLAYFAGRIIGGPKLAPRISPKKTWAGMGGAMAGSALAALARRPSAGRPGACGCCSWSRRCWPWWSRGAISSSPP